MNTISGNIYNYILRKFEKGTIFFDKKILKIVLDETISDENIIIPGFVDAHVHIESSMLTPQYFSKEALKHGVIAAVTDPHEIANVCGIEGVRYMKEEADKCKMKVLIGAPPCVPATSFETSGAVINTEDISKLFEENICSHLSEMMNFPGVISDDELVVSKLDIAKKYNLVIDGHAPGLTQIELKKYITAGITTDHECTTLDEAIEKIKQGMKVLIRRSSASNDFRILHPLVSMQTNDVMLCSDDCHANDMEQGYLKRSISELVNLRYRLEDIIQVASVNPVKHYSIKMGLLQVGDFADFLVVDDYSVSNIISVYIDGEKIDLNNEIIDDRSINNFYVNSVSENDIKVVNNGEKLHVINVEDGSLFTQKLSLKINETVETIESNIESDLLKIVVLNRYTNSKASIGFIKGIGLNRGAIATTVAHDSHNIIACGADDSSIIKAIKRLQQLEGGLVVVNERKTKELSLEVGGLMSNRCCSNVAENYKDLLNEVRIMGSNLYSPFMTLSFMSLLVIPSLKISDKGLFDVDKFQFITLQD